MKWVTLDTYQKRLTEKVAGDSCAAGSVSRRINRSAWCQISLSEISKYETMNASQRSSVAVSNATDARFPERVLQTPFSKHAYVDVVSVRLCGERESAQRRQPHVRNLIGADVQR